ncbi:MAG: MscL family protein [Oscillospiraceae bacterium]|nr:MscL family protein [Ruminococcus sp.]MDE6708284.1 MscL family protein [Oscillospiraceae bacterium]
MGDQYINYSAFLTAVINFVIMAFVIFLMLKTVNKIMHIRPSKEELLLTEIRD